MIRKPFRRFRRADDGAVSVEAMLWMPFFLLLMFGIGEVAFVFHGQARSLQVAQEANRGYAVGRFSSTTEAAAWAASAMSNYSDEIIATTRVDNNLMVITTISIPAKDFAGNIGIFSMFKRVRINVTAEQVVET
jgi:Flp pilus assembly protein TadG